VLTEGGPRLLSSFVERELLDELCLTIAPCVVGGFGPRITTGAGQVLTRMRCVHVLTDESGYLYTRYVRDASGNGG
jgi:riboflavin biosynthesis pyrimidine reductase